jgi:hypothetical protein
MIATGLMLHGGILLVVNVPLFGELMTACYLTFLTPAELDTALGWLNPFRRHRVRAAGSTAAEPVTALRVHEAEGLRGPHAGIATPAGEPVGAGAGLRD